MIVIYINFRNQRRSVFFSPLAINAISFKMVCSTSGLFLREDSSRYLASSCSINSIFSTCEIDLLVSSGGSRGRVLGLEPPFLQRSMHLNGDIQLESPPPPCSPGMGPLLKMTGSSPGIYTVQIAWTIQTTIILLILLDLRVYNLVALVYNQNQFVS